MELQAWLEKDSRDIPAGEFAYRVRKELLVEAMELDRYEQAKRDRNKIHWNRRVPPAPTETLISAPVPPVSPTLTVIVFVVVERIAVAIPETGSVDLG